MTLGERITEIRKSMGFSQREFCEKIGIAEIEVLRLEKGECVLNEKITKSICRECGVDYIWLTTGKGEMFVGSDDIYEKLDCIILGKDERRKKMLKTLIEASDEEIVILQRMFDLSGLK